jgi:hypothetical protein
MVAVVGLVGFQELCRGLQDSAFHQIIARAALSQSVWTSVQSVKTIWDRIEHLAKLVPAHQLEKFH